MATFNKQNLLKEWTGCAALCLRPHHTGDDIQHSSTTLSLICIGSTNYLGLVDSKRNKRLWFICFLNHLFVSASTNSSAAGSQIWQCDVNAAFTIYYHWDPCGPAAGGDNWCNKSMTHTANVHQCEQKSLSHIGLVMFTMGHTRNLDPGIDDPKVWTQVCCVTTWFTIYARVCLKRWSRTQFVPTRARYGWGVEATISTCTVSEQTRRVWCVAVVLNQLSRLNQNMASHGRCWGWKVIQMVIVGASKNKKKPNMHRNKEDWCKDALNCSEHKQEVHLVSSPCVLAVCKQTPCTWPPTVLDCIPVQACPCVVQSKSGLVLKNP